MQKNLLQLYIYIMCLAHSFTSTAQGELSQSNLPIISIHTQGQTILDEPKINCEMRVLYNGVGKINKLSDVPALVARIGVEFRGSTSQMLFPKKPFAIEIRDSVGKDKIIPLLGLPDESDWVLVPAYNDKTLIRDAFSYAVGRELMPYASRTRMVEVMLNDAYWGVYMLAEKVKRDKNRVNVAKNDPIKDISGGYILKLDKVTGATKGGWISPFAPVTGKNVYSNYLYHYPKPEDITPAQADYIQKHITEWEKVMQSPEYYEKYNEYMDLESFVDYAIMNELTKNDDAYRLSTYLYKEKGGKIKMGPIWDFNIALGNTNFCGGDSPKGWVIDYNKVCPDDAWLVPFYWRILKKDNGFLSLFKKRWTSLRKNTLSDAKLIGKIDSLSNVLNDAQARNFKRWAVLGVQVWPNKFVGKTYLDEINYLKDWLKQRTAWLDGEAAAVTPTLETNIFDTHVAELFPNPFTNQIEVKLLDINKNNKYNLLIFNNIGNLLKKINLSDKQMLSLDELPKGMYFYEIRDKQQIVQSNKLIKN